jgi:hypothetical protein
MTKKLEIWRLPPVMVVHLKRFQYTQTYRRKLGSLVEFPIEGLDLSSCVAPHVEFPEKYPMKKPKSGSSVKEVTDEEEKPVMNGSTVKSEDDSDSPDAAASKDAESSVHKNSSASGEVESDARTSSPLSDEKTVSVSVDERKNSTHRVSISADTEVPPRSVVNRVRRGYTNTNLEQSRCLETNYDLYGVVNHQGALGGGHYTAYAKNFVDDQWYYYDDERVRVVEEQQVVSSSAYLLFYLRSDMKGVLVKDLFPPNDKSKKITEEDIDRFVEEGDDRRCQIM